MKDILVTGGCGFVGRNLTKRLMSLGHHVTIIDDLSSGLNPQDWAESGSLTFYHTDLRDYCRKYPCIFDTIFHCAAVVGGRLKIDGDPLAVATDLSIDAELFNWVVRAKPSPKLIYFSSSAVYPIELQTRLLHPKLVEDMTNFNTTRVAMPDQSYGWSKLTGEYLARHAVKSYGLDVVIYRPFSGYGEDQSFDYPFPSIIRRVANREDPIVVWGSGDQQRDFIHIDDVISAVLATKDVLKPGSVLNLGSGEGTTFAELAQIAGRALGVPVKVANDPTKPEGVFSRVADPWRMNQYFKPTISLEEGIRRVADSLGTRQ